MQILRGVLISEVLLYRFVPIGTLQNVLIIRRGVHVCFYRCLTFDMKSSVMTGHDLFLKLLRREKTCTICIKMENSLLVISEKIPCTIVQGL